MNETRQLAKFVTEINYEDLPDEVITKSKGLILDQLGCQLAFSAMPWNKAVFEYVHDRRGSKEESTVVSYGLRTTAEDAAFANAAFGHGFEMDDTEMHTITHPGSVVIPSALALGEALEITGKELLAAIVAGYDVMIRVGMAARSMIQRSFHGTSVTGPFGAAAAACKVLGLNAETVTNALGIAASESSGISEYTISGGSVKRLHAGFAAQAGIRAALLARNGLTGPPTVLEGKKGFCQAFANELHLEDITAGLGREYRIMWTGNKPYCCCAGQHAVIDAASEIAKKHDPNWEDIEEIIIEQMPRDVRNVGNIVEPTDVTSAQFSGRFGVALRLIKGSNGLRDYSMENIGNGNILGLARRVKYIANECKWSMILSGYNWSVILSGLLAKLSVNLAPFRYGVCNLEQERTEASSGSRQS